MADNSGSIPCIPFGCDVKYTISFEKSGRRLLYGDLHIHSTASDGKLSAWEIGEEAKKRGLDFIALANHNNFAENYHLPHIDGLTFIPAVEWTHYKGHMNFFGVKAPFENSFIANTEKEMEKLIKHAKSMGAVISVNHPKCRFCPYLWHNDRCWDMMEIWNGPMRPSNTDAIKLWTEHLKQGRFLPAVGGSDFHGFHQLSALGNPVTAVYADSESADDILDAVKRGRSFITSARDGVKFNIHCGEKTFGDTIFTGGTTEIEISAQNVRHISLYAVSEKGEKLIARPEYDTTEIKFITDAKNFLYIKAVRGNKPSGRILAITNPVYFTSQEE